MQMRYQLRYSPNAPYFIRYFEKTQIKNKGIVAFLFVGRGQALFPIRLLETFLGGGIRLPLVSKDKELESLPRRKAFF